MKILFYRDDGLGDTLFTIPTVAFLLNYVKDIEKIIWVTNHDKLASYLIREERLSTVNVKNIHQLGGNYFDVALFLGPWGKVRSFEHLKAILKVNSGYKFISSYSSKLVFKILKLVLGKKYFFIDFEEIFKGHDILNTFNFVLHSLSHLNLDINYLSLDDKKILELYNYEVYCRKRDVLQRRKVVLHFTYKSLQLGATFSDYYRLVDYLKSKGDLVVTFGPYEKKYWDSFWAKTEKIFIDNINDYIDLCFDSFLFVGFDTGPVHLAAFLNVPYVVSFFPDKGFEYRVVRWWPFSNYSKSLVLRYSDLNKLDKLEKII
ncbi:MAG: hypothetical protein RMJ36_01360 [Candidatus Calescibacterium sp.]|nr:hypothetical protein [Candidatus Calescibacterium sp.]MDW8132288.1 hypothetical protein [Candidatus Calescibacterium sp.]